MAVALLVAGAAGKSLPSVFLGLFAAGLSSVGEVIAGVVDEVADEVMVDEVVDGVDTGAVEGVDGVAEGVETGAAAGAPTTECLVGS